MPDIVLELNGRHFKSQYSLYVVEIEHVQKYFYVGQTGDKKYDSARPAFRRLAVHFEDQGHSTQNQVYRYIAVNILQLPDATDNHIPFSSIIKQNVEQFLLNSKIKMSVYSLEAFNYIVNHEEHLDKVRKVTLFERQVIDLFNRNNRKLMNKNLAIPPINALCPYPEALETLRSEFSLVNEGER